jgi:hypothetical protein
VKLRALPQKRQLTLLACLLGHWQRCANLPRFQRILLRVPALFDYEPVRQTIFALIATDGDWQRAREILRGQSFAPRLFAWAQKFVS